MKYSRSAITELALETESIPMRTVTTGEGCLAVFDRCVLFSFHNVEPERRRFCQLILVIKTSGVDPSCQVHCLASSTRAECWVGVGLLSSLKILKSLSNLASIRA